jgi:RNA polymerase sigma-70 factor (sigma-E family)
VSDPPIDTYREYVQERIPHLRRLAYLLCQDWHLADDLLQETLVRLYLRWDRASQASDVNAFARTTLVREFLSERRTHWSRRVVLVDTLPDHPAAAAPDTASKLAVRSALTGLAPRQRAVIVLRFYADLSVHETAGALGCSAGTVKSQTSKGLATLRRLLPDTEPSTRPGPTRARS